MVVLERAAQEFVDAAARPPFPFQLPLAEGRAGLDALQSGDVDVPKPDAEVTDISVVRGPLGRVPVRVFRPRDVTGPLPVILYLHAGWAFGDTITHDRLMREFAHGARAAVVFPSFSLSPEAEYPTAIDEIYATAAWIAEHGAGYGLDASRVAIAGDSAGGNMSTVVTMMAKERGGPAFVHQSLFYPVLDPSFDTPSFAEFATGFGVRADHVRWLWDQYLPDVARRSERYASPLRATTSELSGLPPAMIITAEADVVRDEAEAYGSRLREAGVPVMAVRYQGTIHDFMLLNVLRETNAARAAIAQAIGTFREAFGVEEGPVTSRHGISG
jgi:acetyl esterase/lipase